MIRQYDPAWVNGVLEDVASFLAENNMPASASAVIHALAVLEAEAQHPLAANVVNFPAAARRSR